MNEIETTYWNALDGFGECPDFSMFQNDRYTSSIRYIGKNEMGEKAFEILITSNDEKNLLEKRMRLLVVPQGEIGRYRADFIFRCYFEKNESPLLFVIEIDGHEWHEKTKSQAIADRVRERYIVSAGYIVIRFTGSEVFKDSGLCVYETVQNIVDYLSFTGKIER